MVYIYNGILLSCKKEGNNAKKNLLIPSTNICLLFSKYVIIIIPVSIQIRLKYIYESLSFLINQITEPNPDVFISHIFKNGLSVPEIQ